MSCKMMMALDLTIARLTDTSYVLIAVPPYITPQICFNWCAKSWIIWSTDYAVGMTLQKLT